MGYASTMTAASLTGPLDAVAMQLRALGLAISTVPGGFCVNDRHGTVATAYWTDDLREALRVGLASPPPPDVEPPLGPMGRKNRHRARMYAHNRRIAAKRRAAAAAREDGTS